jgi:hypothetical protein
MKTKNIGFLAIAVVMANLLAATIGHSQTERFPQPSLGGMRCLQSIVPAQRPSI